MKKLFWCLVLCLMTVISMTSCQVGFLATANYDVCYPDGTQTYEDEVEFYTNGNGNIYVKAYSVGGSNYVSVVDGSAKVAKVKDVKYVL